MSQGTEFVRNWMDAVCRGDLDALAAMTAEGSVHGNPDGTYVGPDGIRDLFRPMLEATSEREAQINNVIESGDTVVVEFALRVKTPATGRTASLKSVAIYDLRDGKLAGSRGMYDRLELVNQLGLPPAPVAVS